MSVTTNAKQKGSVLIMIATLIGLVSLVGCQGGNGISPADREETGASMNEAPAAAPSPSAEPGFDDQAADDSTADAVAIPVFPPSAIPVFPPSVNDPNDPTSIPPPPPPLTPQPDYIDPNFHYEIGGQAELAAPHAPQPKPPLEVTPISFIREDYKEPEAGPVYEAWPVTEYAYPLNDEK